MRAFSPARLAATRVLSRLNADVYSHANEELSRVSVELQLKNDDIRLARTLVFGTLRHALTLDYIFSEHLHKSADKLDTELRISLRLATYQLKMLSRQPDYAVINDTVEIARQHFRMKHQQLGFLNAMLRKVADMSYSRDLPVGNRVQDLSVRYSFPREFVSLLVERYGTHKAISIMENCNTEPSLTVRVNRLKVTPDELRDLLEKKGFQVQDNVLTSDALILGPKSEGVSLFKSTEFAEGLFYVQDEASQLVAKIVAPSAGETILDMCSAPGGKTTYMAELAGGKATITATDLSELRLQLVQENIDRLSTPGISVLPIDSVTHGSSRYDAVLIDAPCSGAGTVRRNPEIRYRLTKEVLLRQQERQSEALTQGARLVKSGGRLIYSTCSISNQENRDVINAFLKKNPDWEISKMPSGEVLESLQSGDGFYRTWPAYPQLDGFEAVVLINTSN